jgi:hypothetical protein
VGFIDVAAVPNNLKNLSAIRALHAFFVQVKPPASAKRADQKAELAR